MGSCPTAGCLGGPRHRQSGRTMTRASKYGFGVVPQATWERGVLDLRRCPRYITSGLGPPHSGCVLADRCVLSCCFSRSRHPVCIRRRGEGGAGVGGGSGTSQLTVYIPWPGARGRLFCVPRSLALLVLENSELDRNLDWICVITFMILSASSRMHRS